MPFSNGTVQYSGMANTYIHSTYMYAHIPAVYMCSSYGHGGQRLAQLILSLVPFAAARTIVTL